MLIIDLHEWPYFVLASCNNALMRPHGCSEVHLRLYRDCMDGQACQSLHCSCMRYCSWNMSLDIGSVIECMT